MLTNKVAIVTGANRGIGKTIAQTFVAQGAFVFACMRQLDSTALEKLAPAEKKDRVKGIALDISDETSIKSAVKEIMAVNAKIDILVNNAGTASGGLFQMTPMAELRRVFEINFFGQIALTQSVSRLMARNRTGSIINIASTAVNIPDLGTLSYGSSKAAIARASRSMATELAAVGVRVNTISPGLTKTDMFDQMAPEARERLISTAAFKRAAEPQDIANVALFLASNLSSFVTGQNLRVDGGMI
jgi:3-oxoacyl-[acyl-carrier protein] reductase